MENLKIKNLKLVEVDLDDRFTKRIQAIERKELKMVKIRKSSGKRWGE